MWAAVREHGSSNPSFTIANGNGPGNPIEIAQGISSFRPIDQGSFYWKHTWPNETSLTLRVGLAENPNSLVAGADARVPLTPRLALTGSFTYLGSATPAVTTFPPWPRANPKKMWNVSVGIEIVPGGLSRHAPSSRFAPLLPVADNGSMGIRSVNPIARALGLPAACG